MIVVSDNDAATKLAATSQSVQAKPLPDAPPDPPPLYSQISRATAESSTSAAQLGRQAPPNIKPTNFVRLVRPSSRISGTWIIDPALRIPNSFLPPLAEDETEATRKNLSLESRNDGVDVVVYVSPTQDLDQKPLNKRVSIHTSSRNGSVTTMVHDIVPTDLQTTRLPLFISTSSPNGRVTVYLPRSFHGLVSVELRNGSLRYSDAMQSMLTPLSDFDRTQRGFVGHFSLSELENDEEWTGDELVVRAENGNVRIFYDDEMDAPSKPTESGFFARLFGA